MGRIIPRIGRIKESLGRRILEFRANSLNKRIIRLEGKSANLRSETEYKSSTYKILPSGTDYRRNMAKANVIDLRIPGLKRQLDGLRARLK